MFGLKLKFLRRKNKTEPQVPQEDYGILVFENTSEVIQAENVLKSAGWPVKVMGPPPGNPERNVIWSSSFP